MRKSIIKIAPLTSLVVIDRQAAEVQRTGFGGLT
jgi:hypothetical protein